MHASIKEQLTLLPLVEQKLRDTEARLAETEARLLASENAKAALSRELADAQEKKGASEMGQTEVLEFWKRQLKDKLVEARLDADRNAESLKKKHAAGLKLQEQAHAAALDGQRNLALEQHTEAAGRIQEDCLRSADGRLEHALKLEAIKHEKQLRAQVSQ
jgi:hypothetical protein